MVIQNKTVLLVDDDVDVLEQYRAVIGREFEVDLAHTGEEALEKVEKNRYACIVMDVMMQNLGDGLDVAKKIKENPATSDIPIIMATAVTQYYDYRDQIDEDFFPKDLWLEKPIDPENLLREIRKITKKE